LQTKDSSVAFGQGWVLSFKNGTGIGFNLQIYRRLFQVLLAAFGRGLFRRCCLPVVLLLLAPQLARAGYLDENPEEVLPASTNV
jgi:hypothetical protein